MKRNFRNRYRKFYNSRNRYNNNIKNGVPQSLKTMPQRFGTGKNIVRIDIPYEFENTSPGTTQNAVVQVGSAVSTTTEWSNCSRDFKFFKIIVVNIILPPRPAPTNQTFLNAKIFMDWSDSTIENVTTNDNAKEAPFFSTRTKVYKFLPVNAMLHSFGNNITYNYGRWLPVDLMSAQSPGWLKISSEFSFSFRMEVVCEFRSNETQVTNTTKTVIYGQIMNSSSVKDLKEDEEEPKEEEIKEENINKFEALNMEENLDEKIQFLNHRIEQLKKLKVQANVKDEIYNDKKLNYEKAFKESE